MTTLPDPADLDPRFLAGVQLLERTGARSFRLGWSDDNDGPPTVWYAVAGWQSDTGKLLAEVSAALDPVTAVMRLCETVIDGGHCTHCDRQTIFDDNPTDTEFDELLNALGCVYGYDPELATFRRACEGDAP